MSLFNIGDWFSGNGQTQAEADANLHAQQQDLRDQIAYQKENGTYNRTPEQQAADAALLGQTAGRTTDAALSGFGSGLGALFTGSKADGSSGPGAGAVVKDLFILAAIGGALWAFVKFGGAKSAGAAAKRVKLGWVGVIGIGALALLILWNLTKKTASDAGAVASNVFTSPLKTLFG